MNEDRSENSTMSPHGGVTVHDILSRAETLQRTMDISFRDKIVESIYADAEVIANRVVTRQGVRAFDLDQRIDRIVTSKVWGLPLMFVLLAGVFWITIVGANYPSKLLAILLFRVEDQGDALPRPYRGGVDDAVPLEAHHFGLLACRQGLSQSAGLDCQSRWGHNGPLGRRCLAL